MKKAAAVPDFLGDEDLKPFKVLVERLTKDLNKQLKDLFPEVPSKGMEATIATGSRYQSQMAQGNLSIHFPLISGVSG